LSVADRIAAIERGQVIFSGTGNDPRNAAELLRRIAVCQYPSHLGAVAAARSGLRDRQRQLPFANPSKLPRGGWKNLKFFNDIKDKDEVGAPASMKQITTFPLEHHDISAFGLRMSPRASGARRSCCDRLQLVP
jgi:hypothetical protein